MSDAALVEFNGADYTLYLIFERYAAYFFLILSFLSLSVFMPIYLTGTAQAETIADESAEYGYSVINKITLLNISID